MYIKAGIVAIFTGIFIEIFFKLLKRNKLANPPTKYIPYNNYVSVTEFVNLGNRRWLNYLAFRCLPPALLITLSTAIYQKYFNILNTYMLVMVSTMISLIPRDIFLLFNKKTYFSEKVVHTINILTLILIALAVSFMGTMIDISVLAPSVEGVIDNAWSTLLVAMLVLIYTDVASQKSETTYNNADNTKLRNFVLSRQIKFREKYGEHIKVGTEKYNVYKPLIYAIIIYEDLNRPAIIRYLESVIVRLSKQNLTVGIAQVKSNRPLKDTESISKACKILKNSYKHHEDEKNLKANIRKYNKDEEYINSIMKIIHVLRMS